MADSTHSTPKRKHAELHNNFVPNLNTTTQFTDFTFALGSPESGAESPRTIVARRFHGLAIGGGGGSGGGVDSSTGSSPTASSTNSPEVKKNHSAFLAMALQDEDLDPSRKRLKLPGVALPVSETPPMHSPGSKTRKAGGPRSPRRLSLKSGNFSITNSPPHPNNSPSKVLFALSPTEPTAKPRARARAGTPPLTYRPSASPDPDAASSPFVTDALRASLTWHDDEITIYDPEDSEDDGTGINGIGFKPTPAVAYARTERRRQQLAEYRKREEREARAKRSQRRRGSPVAGLVELKGSMERRKVRFMESATELISF